MRISDWSSDVCSSDLPTNLTDYIAFFSAQHGDATFLVEGNERLSFAQTFAAVRKVAAGLIEGHGVQRGDRVALAMRNAHAWCITYQIGRESCRERVCKYV